MLSLLLAFTLGQDQTHIQHSTLKKDTKKISIKQNNARVPHKKVSSATLKKDNKRRPSQSSCNFFNLNKIKKFNNI